MKSVAKIHKAKFESLVEEAGIDIEVRMIPEREAGSSDSDNVFGPRGSETSVGESKTVKVVWSNDYVRPEAVVGGDVSESIATLATDTSKLDVIIRLPLEDALLKPDLKQGKTIFHVCRDVIHNGAKFKVTGTKRTGLPPLGPYILWVGLVKYGGE